MFVSYNGNGQLGIGNTSDQNTPQQITTQTFDGSGVGELKKFNYKIQFFRW